MFAWQQTESSAGALEESGAYTADSIMVYISNINISISSCVAKQETERIFFPPREYSGYRHYW
jgi:hypothetical protein